MFRFSWSGFRVWWKYEVEVEVVLLPFEHLCDLGSCISSFRGSGFCLGFRVYQVEVLLLPLQQLGDHVVPRQSMPRTEDKSKQLFGV